jgi:transcriptional regulator with PAS, ATPase and Fis domain
MKEKSDSLVKEIDLKLEFLDSLLQEKRYKEALAEIRDVEATQRLDESSPEFGHFCYYSAEVFRRLGDYQTALSKANTAFEIFKNTSENKRIAQIKYTLGNIHIALGDLMTAKEELYDSLVTYKRIDDDRGRISVSCMLANICFQQSNYQMAIEYLFDSIKLCDKIENQDIKARGFSNLSRIYILLGEWQLAQDNLLSASKIFEEKSDKLYLCRALLSLGYVCCLQRDFKKANKYYEQAVKIIFENSYTREFAIYHEYAGELEFAQGKYEEAKNHYLDCIGIMQEVAPESDMISQTYRLLAELQIAEKQYDEALSSCEKALKVAESLGEKIEIGATHRALGQIHTAKKEKQKAKENFEKSIYILEQIGAKFESGKAYLEAGESNCFEYFERLKFLGKAEDLFKELESKYHQGLVSLALAHLMIEHNGPEKAQIFLNSAEKMFVELSEVRELKLVSDLKKKLSFTSVAPSFPRKVCFSDIITQSPEMLSVIEKAKQIKDSIYTILLEGETGTGKDLLARAIHYESRFKDKPFVPVNCAAIPKELVESELFGYKRGAFTGASSDKKGLMEEADGGTLFLNEIAELPITIQAKLLESIEYKQITRLGDTKSRQIDFRVIVASNQDLEKEVKSGNFREDLYYRLNVIKLVLPPLRERKGDLPLLVDHFLKKHFSDEKKEHLDFHPILKLFEEYHWPGNVREMENEFRKYTSISELIDGFNKWDKSVTIATSGKLMEMEKAEILETIKATKNKREAANLLGISLATLYRKIKFYDLNI